MIAAGAGIWAGSIVTWPDSKIEKQVVVPISIAMIVIGLVLGILSILTKPTHLGPEIEASNNAGKSASNVDSGEAAFTGSSATAKLDDKENASILERVYGKGQPERRQTGES